jgi:hypothetical protein
LNRLPEKKKEAKLLVAHPTSLDSLGKSRIEECSLFEIHYRLIKLMERLSNNPARNIVGKVLVLIEHSTHFLLSI